MASLINFDNENDIYNNLFDNDEYTSSMSIIGGREKKTPQRSKSNSTSSKKQNFTELNSSKVLNINIDPDLDRDKYLEALSIRRSYFYADNMRALDIVKKFIKNKERIIYGGTAVDFALRAEGSHIYPDEFMNFPDLDFYSPDNVQDSYELAEELFNAGIENISAIVAYHTQTMRVRFNMISVADISYMPLRIYSKLKYIEFDGYRVVHPHHQFIDMHISMAFPFRNAPREVILDRKNKDYERFNKLLKYYPITRPGVSLVAMSVSPNTKIPKDAMLIGLSAYAVYIKMAADIGINISQYPSAKLSSSDDTLTLDWYPPTPPITYFIRADELNKPTHESWMNSFPPSTSTPNTIYYHAQHERYHVSEYDERIVASAQYTLAFLLYQYEETENPAYLIYYHSLLYLINEATEKIGDIIQDSILSPFTIPLQYWPSADTVSISSALDISLKTCLLSIGQYKGEPIIKPHAFYPDVISQPPVQFDYQKSEYFQISGGPIIPASNA